MAKKSKGKKDHIEINLFWVVFAIFFVFLVVWIFRRLSTGHSVNMGDVSQYMVVPSKFDEDPVLGDINKAKFLVFEYSDFACPVCQRFRVKEFPVIKEYVLKHGGAWVGKYFVAVPSHKIVAEPAMVVATCVKLVAGNSVYWQFSQKVYEGLYNNKIPTIPLDKYYSYLVKLAELPFEQESAVNECLDKYGGDPSKIYSQSQAFVEKEIGDTLLPAGYNGIKKPVKLKQVGLGTPMFVVCTSLIDNQCRGYPILGYKQADEFISVIEKVVNSKR